MNELLKTYWEGWVALVKGGLVIGVWVAVVFLPMFLLQHLLPNQMEGKAEGAKWVQLAAFGAFTLWAPFVAYGLGPLRFREIQKKDEGQPTSPSDVATRAAPEK
ncbi:MAG: hypothetical protein WCO77_05130 [bacterium]